MTTITPTTTNITQLYSFFWASDKTVVDDLYEVPLPATPSLGATMGVSHSGKNYFFKVAEIKTHPPYVPNEAIENEAVQLIDVLVEDLH